MSTSIGDQLSSGIGRLLLLVTLCSAPVFASVSSIEKLISRGQIADGASLYNSERDSIASQPKLLRRMCESAPKVAAEVGRESADQQRRIEAFVWPAEPYHWPSLARAVAEASAYAKRVSGYRLLSDCSALPAQLTALDRAIKATNEKVAASAPQHFRDHLAKGRPIDEFFAGYPAPLERVEFMRANATSLLSAAVTYEPETIGAMVVAIGESAEPGQRAAFGKLLLEKTLHASATQRKDGQKVADALTLIEVGSRTTALDVREVPGLWFLPQLPGAEGACKFETTPSSAEEVTRGDLPLKLRENVANHLVVASCAPEGFERRAEPMLSIRSQAVVGTRQGENPDLFAARLEVQRLQAQMESERASQNVNNAIYGSNLGKALIQGLSLGVIEQRLQVAQARLAQLPPFVDLPILADYSYKRVDAKHTKNASVTIALVSREDRSTRYWSVPVKQTLALEELYDVRPNDSNPQLVRKSQEWQPALARFREQELALSLDDVVPVIASVKPRQTSEVALVDVMSKKAVTTPIVATASLVSAVGATRDKRMESVVVVRTPTGLGSGFFIAPAYVVTNAHVVEGTPFVELKNSLGQISQAEVVVVDSRRDLALLKTNLSGRIATLGVGAVTSVGATIEVLGHPEGLEFSLSRGAISALRAMPSKRDPGAAKVLFLQTDAAINQGNSGGPIFLGDSVVGVATMGLVAVDIQGLNFAVHVQELAGFLASAGVSID